MRQLSRTQRALLRRRFPMADNPPLSDSANRRAQIIAGQALREQAAAPTNWRAVRKRRFYRTWSNATAHTSEPAADRPTPPVPTRATAQPQKSETARAERDGVDRSARRLVRVHVARYRLRVVATGDHLSRLRKRPEHPHLGRATHLGMRRFPGDRARLVRCRSTRTKKKPSTASRPSAKGPSMTRPAPLRRTVLPLWASASTPA